MIRAVCGLILLLFVVAGVIASNHVKPLAVDPHASGQWTFNKADFQQCVRVQLPPLRATPSIRGSAVVQPIA